MAPIYFQYKLRNERSGILTFDTHRPYAGYAGRVPILWGAKGEITCLPSLPKALLPAQCLQFLTVIVAESTAFLPDTPSSPARMPRYSFLSHCMARPALFVAVGPR